MNSVSKSLVAYFSASGTTKAAADRLAALIDADIFEIVPAVPYEKPDLDWTDPKSRTTLEMKDPACRPAVKSLPDSVDAYDRIFVGFPIWWYTAPRIIESFLDGIDLKGKLIVPFATSGGSEMGDTEEDLRKSCGAKVSDGFMFRRNVSDDDILSWVGASF